MRMVPASAVFCPRYSAIVATIVVSSLFMTFILVVAIIEGKDLRCKTSPLQYVRSARCFAVITPGI